MIHYDPLWSTMIHYDPLWSTNMPLWSTMIHYDPLICHYDKQFHKISPSSTFSHALTAALSCTTFVTLDFDSFDSCSAENHWRPRCVTGAEKNGGFPLRKLVDLEWENEKNNGLSPYISPEKCRYQVCSKLNFIHPKNDNQIGMFILISAKMGTVFVEYMGYPLVN